MRHNSDQNNNKYAHISVFYREVLSQVQEIKDIGNKVFMDCTLGEGGHSELLLEHFSDLKIIAVERDPEILEVAKKRLNKFGGRISFVNDNFARAGFYLEGQENTVSGFLYDFGISSYHFDLGKRGFSYTDESSLDMRLDPDCKEDAAYIVNNYPEKKLADIFFNYGEERWSKNIVRYIIKAREEKKIKTARQLADIVLRAIPGRFQVKNIHPATRVFQALRIAVNNELSAIKTALLESWKFLAPEGRLLAISFHSLEDRIVKNCFRSLAKGCYCSNDEICRCDRIARVKILTKKPLVPLKDEIEHNRRARSARLRICKKI